MPESWTEGAGWLPAVILPVSTLLQLVKLVRTRTAAGTSALAWALFGVANLGAWVFTGRLAAPQSVLAFLLPGILDAVIVVLCLRYREGAAAPRG
jgi:uncharacterized protein with PQ loop repeat